jgi:hypothetical protein
MSTLEDIKEEARVARKLAGEKSDWLNNPYVKKRYEADQNSLARKHEEMMTLFRAADRLDHYASILASRAA